MTTTVPEPVALASTPSVERLRVKIFADGANLDGMIELARDRRIDGFTTNPTLMKAAGVTDYRAFAHEVLAAIPDRSISFEVFSDELDEMERQAREIASWGEHVYVKIPVSNTRGESTGRPHHALSHAGVKVNVTALMTLDQVRDVAEQPRRWRPELHLGVRRARRSIPAVIRSPLMAACVDVLRPHPQIELIWASPRELLNVFQADAIGCHIITVTHDVLKKLALVGKDLDDYSLETVKMFRSDAVAAGFSLE